MRRRREGGGIGVLDHFMLIGSMIAVTVSYQQWDSIYWAMTHGLFGWLYLAYLAWWV